MIDMKLNNHDEQLLKIYDAFYSCCVCKTDGNTWSIGSPEDTIEFKTYKAFIRYIEDEVKEVLLVYAMRGDTKELCDVLNSAYDCER